MRFGSLRAVLLGIRILWNKTLCVLVESYWHFEESKFLHIQVQAIRSCWKRHNSSEKLTLSYGVTYFKSREEWLSRLREISNSGKYENFPKTSSLLFNRSKHE